MVKIPLHVPFNHKANIFVRMTLYIHGNVIEQINKISHLHTSIVMKQNLTRLKKRNCEDCWTQQKY